MAISGCVEISSRSRPVNSCRCGWAKWRSSASRSAHSSTAMKLSGSSTAVKKPYRRQPPSLREFCCISSNSATSSSRFSVLHSTRPITSNISSSLLLGRLRRVALVQHQRVRGGSAEERHGADGGDERVHPQLPAALLEFRPSGRHVFDVERDRVAVHHVRQPH